jgi:hypothetical protein
MPDITPPSSGSMGGFPVYEPSKKHKRDSTTGRHGSICPPTANGQELLDRSVADGRKRYATDGLEAFCAQEHRPDRWHGYPVSWDEVPGPVVAAWISTGQVERRTIRRAKRRLGR